MAETMGGSRRPITARPGSCGRLRTRPECPGRRHRLLVNGARQKNTFQAAHKSTSFRYSLPPPSFHPGGGSAGTSNGEDGAGNACSTARRALSARVPGPALGVCPSTATDHPREGSAGTRTGVAVPRRLVAADDAPTGTSLLLTALSSLLVCDSVAQFPLEVLVVVRTNGPREVMPSPGHHNAAEQEEQHASDPSDPVASCERHYTESQEHERDEQRAHSDDVVR